MSMIIRSLLSWVVMLMFSGVEIMAWRIYSRVWVMVVMTIDYLVTSVVAGVVSVIFAFTFLGYLSGLRIRSTPKVT